MIGRLPGGDDRDELVRAWEDALASLEHDLGVAERMLAGPLDVVPTAPTGAASWSPPQLGGPVPDGLVGRARDLLRRQADVRAGLSRSVEKSRASLEALRPRHHGAAVRSAAYVDISA